MRIVNFGIKATRIFARTGGGSGCLQIAEGVDPRGMEQILRDIQLNNGEFPIICGKDAREYICLLTNTRFCVHDDGLHVSVALDKIIDVKSEVRSLKARDSVKRLQVFTNTERLDFSFRTDSDLVGIWNVLLFVAEHNRSLDGLKSSEPPL
ncbi:MAG: hypothetical protein IPJ30_09820 [Acidobacteria bacterium]|nr:hypothetical protein [Acidobacteriota bacterium]MBK8147148.1 hypothetical protein [Acidobacteriota bacterium]